MKKMAKVFLVLLAAVATIPANADSDTLLAKHDTNGVACAPNNVAYWTFFFRASLPGNVSASLAVDANGKPLTCDQARQIYRDSLAKRRNS